MVETFRLGGIKLSGELVQIDIHESTFSAEMFVKLLGKITEAEITIPHLHQRKSESYIQSTFCLEKEDFLRVQDVVSSFLQNSRGTILHEVGTITLFPHRFELGLFASVVQTLANESIPLYGVSTSVSAIVIQTDYALLEQGFEAILQVCDLPENHTPLRPVVLLGDQAVETVAVYWEPKIRIYGMDLQCGLSHLALKCPANLLTSDRWQEIAANRQKFRLLLAQKDKQENFCCDFIIDSNWKKSLYSDLEDCIAGGSFSSVVCEEEVDLVSFHGPHFQDRFGIAERVLEALHEDGIQLLASGCTGTSVNVVVIAGAGDAAVECLNRICMIPSRDNKS